MRDDEPAIFSLSCGASFVERICERLGLRAGQHEERGFEDGEYKIRPLESVRNRDVFVVQSLFGDEVLSVNDKLCRVLFFLAALRDAGARRVTAVVPYLCYARKDRRTKARDPVTSRYVAELFEGVRVDCFVAIDVHNAAAFHNAFRIPAVHLTAMPMFLEALEPLIGDSSVVVVSPDAGGVKRAELFRRALEHRLDRHVDLAFLEKFRSEGVLSGDAVVGSVSDRIAIVIDDLVASGATLVRAATACGERGARTVYAVATHGIFAGNAVRDMSSSGLERIFVADTIPVSLRGEVDGSPRRIEVLDSAPLIAEAISALHGAGSLRHLVQESFY